MTDYEECRRLFVEEQKSLREIAETQDINYRTLQKRSAREKWSEQRKEAGAQQKTSVDRVARKLLERIEDKLQEEGGLEVKDFKTVSGALKEIHEICGKDKSGADSGALTVRFVGETEEMSR